MTPTVTAAAADPRSFISSRQLQPSPAFQVHMNALHNKSTVSEMAPPDEIAMTKAAAKEAMIAAANARIASLEACIKEALMHLDTNYDIDGNRMSESDAARVLRSSFSTNVKVQPASPAETTNEATDL